MTYCPHCGGAQPEPQTDAAAAADAVEAAAVSSAEVEIEKIRAEKEITLARIAAKQVDPAMAADLAAAEAKADVLEDIVTPPEPEPEAPPVIVEAPAPEPEPEPEPDVPAPPVAAGPRGSRDNKGWWSAYR